MTASRLFNKKKDSTKVKNPFKYKYPKDEASTRGREATKAICKQYKVVWVNKFRQRDVIEKSQDLLVGSANQTGHCQVLVTMYLHLRELALDFPEIGRKLFKYWCFLDYKSVIALSQDPKNFGSVWLNGYIKGNKDFIKEYFLPKGHFSLLNVAKVFWGGHSARKQALQNEGVPEKVKIFSPDPPGSTKSFQESHSNDLQSTDDWDFLRLYLPDFILSNNSLYVGVQNVIGSVIAKEIFENNKEAVEFRILVNLKNNNEDSHAVSLCRYKDDPKHIEFVDGNRGIFRIPNDPEKVEKFLSSYFNQSVYETFNFSKVQVETYRHVSPSELSPTSIARKSSSEKRLREVRSNLGLVEVELKPPVVNIDTPFLNDKFYHEPETKDAKQNTKQETEQVIEQEFNEEEDEVEDQQIYEPNTIGGKSL